MRTWIVRVSLLAIVVLVAAYVVAPNPLRPGLRVIEGNISPERREVCASLSGCAAAEVPLEINVRGRIIKLSAERSILDGACAMGKDSTRRLRVYGHLRTDLSEMTAYKLEVDCGDEWSLLERWPRRVPSVVALVN